jgi:K+-transporting ATPase KdpF subunit
MVLLYSLMGALVAALFVYLVIALLKPELFP